MERRLLFFIVFSWSRFVVDMIFDVIRVYCDLYNLFFWNLELMVYNFLYLKYFMFDLVVIRERKEEERLEGREVGNINVREEEGGGVGRVRW